MTEFNKDPEELALSTYMDEIDSQLETDNSKFVYGDGVYVGTEVLMDFYKGKQWLYKKEGGGTMRTFNYCYTVVENMTAFLANESPETHSIPRDMSDEVERIRSESIDQFLGEVHRLNKFPTMFQKSARCGSLYGVSFVFGPIWNEEDKMIKYYNVENPAMIRPIWRDSNFTEMVGFINTYYVSPGSFKNQFKKQLEERKINIDGLTPLTSSSPRPIAEGHAKEPTWKKFTSGGQKMLEVQQYYDDTYCMTRVRGEGKSTIIVDYTKHDYGFVPGLWITNIHLPGSAVGTSDLENILDTQVAYNEAKSNEEDILKQVAFTSLWGKNLENYSVIETGVGQLYNFNDEAELNAMPRASNPLVMATYESGVQGDMMNLSGQNQALYPGGARSVLASTGRALSILMQGVNNKISLRKNFWKEALETLNRNILILAEKKVKNADVLVDKNYRTDVFISSVMLRDVTEEINKFNSKLQSMTTTQKNLGIPSPSEEQKLMKEELKDPIFGVEISRQPGLLQQVLQQIVQSEMARQQAVAQEEQAMAGGEENPQAPMMTQEGAGTGPQPASTPQQGRATGTSPAGAVAAAGQRNTGVPMVKGKK